MKLSNFDYDLPKELIAQEPACPRDHSRLLVLDKKSGRITHRHFFEIIDFLQPGDVLVANKSKVFPARLLGCKKTGGKVEIFLHKQLDEKRWEALGRRVKVGDEISFPHSELEAMIQAKQDELIQVEFNLSEEIFFSEIEKIGLTPLPPYIKRDKKINSDKENYQTIFAQERGSVAVPTAGLHFTPDLIGNIKDKGVQFEEVTLHVGLGTFAPVKSENILDHTMHSEYYSIGKKTLEAIQKAKKEGRRVIAIGTTTTRVLETIFRDTSYQLSDTNLSGWTNIFIYPGYKFKCIDGLITNFHLPKSTLLMLVSALAGKRNIDRAYQEAIKEKYRFYSYGDAMLII